MPDPVHSQGITKTMTPGQRHGPSSKAGQHSANCVQASPLRSHGRGRHPGHRLSWLREHEVPWEQTKTGSGNVLKWQISLI